MKTSKLFFNAQMLGFFRVLVALTVLMNLVAAPLQAPVLASGTDCVTSGPTGGAYTVRPCITAPADGATLTGAQTISATYTTTGANPGVAKFIFYLNGNYVLTDYQATSSVYSFTLPSNKFVDGLYTLEVEALMKDGFTSQRASISVTLSNGVFSPPNPQNTFAPTSGTTPAAGQPFTIVTAGDGADGANNAGNVTNLINSWNPNLFLYVGDVYEKGTATEFYNWYGQASTFYGRFKSVTDPVIGNHEYENGVAPGYHDYWDLGNNAPTYYSYDAAGWHFIALNSNCGLLHICDPGQVEYQWLLNDLNTHNNVCTIAYFHHPIFNAGPEGYATAMNNIWALMASKGVDIVLTGHDHDYQRWAPLDGNVNNSAPNGIGNPSSTGITEFVAGTGGHGIQQFTPTGLADSRMVVGFDTSPFAFGALRLQLNNNGASFQFINSTGQTLDSGAIPCNGAPADTTVPTTPTNLTVTAHSSTQADLNWTGSTDNVGVAGYDIYRNGSLFTSVGYVTSFSDTNLTMGATYQYQVKARDAAGNTSAFSNMTTVTMPSVLFSDGFESGNFNAWTNNTGVVVTAQDHYAGAFAAQAISTGAGASFVQKALDNAQTDLYYSMRFKINSKSSSTSAYIQRFRAGSTGGTALGGVFISSTNRLGYRNDHTASNNVNPGPIVTLGVWHEVQTHFHINGGSGQIEVWYDGAPVSALTATEDFGTSPITRIYAGDSSTTNVFDEVFDEVALNTSFINTTDSQSPSIPTALTATATAPNFAHLTWNASSDNISVTGYDLYRNGSLAANLGAVTSYDDTPVTPGVTYQYQILARDGAGNVSALSTPASVTMPADTTSPTVSLTAPTDGLTVSGTILLAADAADNVDVDHVDFLINNAVIATVGEGGPYNYLWDTTTVPDGTTAVITARATDTSSNITTSTSRTVTVNNGAGDTLPPSLPGNFTAVAAGATRADLSWSASTDNFGVTAYDIYRDGTLLTSTDGATTSYSDSSVTQGSTYQYQVQARDMANNVSGLTSAISVTIPMPLFKDGFESGTLSNWTNSGLSIQQQSVLEGAYAAEANSTGPATWAYTLLGTARTDLYAQFWFKIISKGANNVNLLRFRSGTTGTGGAILGVFVSTSGKLGITNDINGGSTTSTTNVSAGWHALQAHVNTVTGQVDVWLDGAPTAAISQILNLSSASITRIQIGESTTPRTYDVAFDEVAYDTSKLQLSSTLNTIIDSGPLGLSNSSSASFNFSSTSAGATFECGLDGSAFSACIPPSSYTGLTDGSHTFSVRALDGLGGVDQTPASRIWTIDTTPPTVTSVIPTDTATGVALNTAVRATFSEPVVPASISGSTFILTLQGDTTSIPATVTYDVATNTATLQPSALLANSTAYTATIKGGAGGAADLAGNPLAADMLWSFTTVAPDTTAPTVSVTAPTDGSTVAGTVTLFATATDDAGINHVDFLVNGTIVGTVNTAPYSFDWNSVPAANGLTTITAQAVDTSNNTGASAPISVTVNNDKTPPSIPTGLAANAASSAQVDLSWTASTDNVAVTGYDIFRNGVKIKTIGNLVSYSDTTAAPGTTYQYQVQAFDAAANPSGLSGAVGVTTPAGWFSDRFETGDLSQWTTVNGNMVVQQQQVYSGNYAARAVSTGTIADTFKNLSAPQYDLYYDIHLKILTLDPNGSVYVMRFRKADTLSSVGIFVSSTGKLGYRNDISGQSNTSGTGISLNAWHELQAHVHVDSAGGAGLVETWLDGALVQSLAEGLGNAPITQIQLSDSTGGRTYDIAFDNVSVAPNYINPGDITPPSTPANVNAAAVSISQINLIWDASTDDFGVVGYDVYRNGQLLASLAAVTSYSDMTTVPSTTYQYQVAARDAADNISALSNPASVTTPADTTPPTVTLTSPINGAAIGNGVDTLTATATDDFRVARVDFLVNGTVVGSDATSPYSFDWNSTSLPDGPATIKATAWDVSSNSASSSANVTLDNTPPDTAITSQPLTLTNSTTANFSFTKNDTTATFSCSLDNAAFAACTSPQSYTALTNGSHTFVVKATDLAGNVDPTPASFTWTVDTVAPTVSSTIPTSNASNVPPITTVVANFSEAMNPATITSSTFTVRKKQGGSPVTATVTYDPATNKATLQPAANLAAQTAYTATITGGASGVKDLAGNPLAANLSWNFTTSILDTTPPTVTLTAPANGAKVKGNVTLSATASDNVVVASVSFLVNGTVVGTDTTSPYSFIWNSTSLTDGAASIQARAVDPSNNSTTTTNINVTVDNTPPDTTITSGPTGTVASTSATFNFTATETATFACKLDGGSFSACTSPVTYTALAGGAHTFQVQATDTAGNVDSTPASQSWSAVVPPDTTITAGPSGTVTTTTATFSFTSTINGSTFTCSLDGAAFTACTSSTTYSNLANGSHTFQVAATAQGITDPTPASRTWTINLAPDTTISSGPTGAVNTGSATFSFTATVGGSTFTCSLDGAPFTTCTTPKTYTALANGSHTFQVAATSQGATDPTPASRTWTVDMIAPTGVAITAPSNGSSVTGQVTISASASDNVGIAQVDFYVDGQLLSSDTSSPFSVTWNTKKASLGNHTLFARAIDTAGNMTQSPSVSVTVR